MTFHGPIFRRLPAIFSLLAILCLIPGSIFAQGVVEYIENAKVSALSSDGSVAVGYTPNNLDVFRWTSAGGIENLNGSTLAIGVGGGEPQVNADGTRISACIPAPDSLTVTQGLWTQGSGWQALTPPTAPGGGVSSGSHGTPWGISGDGNMVVGLFWLATQKARASSWTAATGLIDLGTEGNNSRANDTNGDGSVIVGWSDNPDTGDWQPAVWENGALTVLDPQGHGMVTKVTRSGHLLFGSSADSATFGAQATIWSRSESNENGWQEVLLGVLPGTVPEQGGRSIIEDGSYDGRILIGRNHYTTFSFKDFIWTSARGLETASAYFARIGIDMGSSFRIERVSAISEDGRVIAGYGTDLYNPGVVVSFIVTNNDPSSVPVQAQNAAMALEANYPNPFNPSTTIALRMDRGFSVRLEVFDTRGSLVRVLHDGHLGEGRHQFRWDGKATSGRPVASGVYLAKARSARGDIATRRLMLVK